MVFLQAKNPYSNYLIDPRFPEEKRGFFSRLMAIMIGKTTNNIFFQFQK